MHEFSEKYNMLSAKQKKLIDKIIWYLPHTQVSYSSSEKLFIISDNIERIRKERGLTQIELCQAASTENKNSKELTIDTYKSILKRNYQNSKWYKYIAIALGVRVCDLKTRTEYGLVQLEYESRNIHDTKYLYSTLTDEHKKFVMFIMKEIQIMDLK